MQAGSSEAGRQFAARWAEMIFTVQRTLPDMRRFCQDMRQRTQGFGRQDGACDVLTAVDPIIGATEAEAKELVNPELGMALLSGHTGIDLFKYPADSGSLKR